MNLSGSSTEKKKYSNWVKIQKKNIKDDNDTFIYLFYLFVCLFIFIYLFILFTHNLYIYI